MYRIQPRPNTRYGPIEKEIPVKLYDLPEDLQIYDYTIERRETYEVAEVAIAVSERIGENIDVIHPRVNNEVKCDIENQEIFFPEDPDEDDDKDPGSPWYGWIKAHENEEQWYISKRNQEYAKQMEAKALCLQCPARTQCLIWSLLTEDQVREEEMSKPVRDRYMEPFHGVAGGWGPVARKKILESKKRLMKKGDPVSAKANEEGQIIVEAAKHKVPHNQAKALAASLKVQRAQRRSRMSV